MTVKFLGCRTQFEVRVGHRHSVDVVLHIRREDITSMRTAEKWGEILFLLQDSILPRLFHDEIEISTARLGRKKMPPELGIGGIPLETGEKNQQARRRKGTSAAHQDHQPKDPTKKNKDIYYAFGKSVKLAYRLQDAKSAPSATLVVNEKANCSHRRYRLLSKLPQTILVWGYSCDVNTSHECHVNTDEVMLSAGRPEFIPTSALFRRAP
jgi:hypothetical protein